ncbi:hypothetical protein D3273_20980 [Lichenibacterium minor]|uniref:Prolyl 4-hydroxylase alpha subunit Fe(2+) 2OG dioxygenase domain-containing protein n=1 Tax=Lichenibacterium minor TaxID=2316528 RepID=A0A4Q2U4U5_9HYPH|nr:2OG-Fe(II) oxygenase [Lichenibacterium minor]RYC30011.1 hypothetical protein D3273_20980 [Lichenibacterium minor]
MSAMTVASDVRSINSDDIVASTSEGAYHIIRGLFDPEEIRRSLHDVRERVLVENDAPSSGTRPDQIMDNFQKWSIGMKSAKDTLGRFFRIVYNLLWCDDIYGMHRHFRKLIEIRNQLSGMPLDFAKQMENGNLYSACRMQHYPQGGGFMQAHQDHVAEANLVGSEQSRFIQLVLIMNEVGPGKDYEAGGAFVIDKAGRKIATEQNTAPGDVVIYDGRSVHGVDDVDPHKLLDITLKTGRIAAFTTIYKKWDSSLCA